MRAREPKAPRDGVVLDHDLDREDLDVSKRDRNRAGSCHHAFPQAGRDDLIERRHVVSCDGEAPAVYQSVHAIAGHPPPPCASLTHVGATKPSLARGVPRALVEAALSATDSREFRTKLRPLLRVHVAFDAYCVNTCDPVTRAVTSSVGDGLSPGDARKLFAIERAGGDVNLLADLASEGPAVATLQAATRGKPHSSRRMREIFAPLGFCDELRAALVLGERPWGYLHLFRKERPFDVADVRRIESAAPVIALGLAKSLVAAKRGRRVAFEPELIVIDRRGKIVNASARARSLVSELDCDGHQVIPHGIAAARSGRDAGCFRIASGAWVAFRGFDVGGRVAVLVDRATPEEIARTVLLAFRLTAREKAVAQLLVDGLSNAQIAHELRISLHTAKDHVKAVLAKTDTESRAHLTRLLGGAA